MEKLLGLLLHIANSSRSCLAQNEFYAIKEKILKKYGRWDGLDMQHIKKECWTCDGTGIYKCSWKMPDMCYHCMGTGTYEQLWVILNRYYLGDYCFHQPKQKFYSKPTIPDGLPIIEGYIKHRHYNYYLSAETKYWLYLFYDFKTFKRVFGRIGHCGTRFTPMVVLGTLYFHLRHFKFKRVLEKIIPKKLNSVATEDELPF